VKLTVVVEDIGAAANIGGSVAYRRVTLDLTGEQIAALKLRDEWERYGTTFIEPAPAPQRPGGETP
jgi:hypothetical protein